MKLTDKIDWLDWVDDSRAAVGRGVDAVADTIGTGIGMLIVGSIYGVLWLASLMPLVVALVLAGWR